MNSLRSSLKKILHISHKTTKWIKKKRYTISYTCILILGMWKSMSCVYFILKISLDVLRCHILVTHKVPHQMSLIIILDTTAHQRTMFKAVIFIITYLISSKFEETITQVLAYKVLLFISQLFCMFTYLSFSDKVITFITGWFILIWNWF